MEEIKVHINRLGRVYNSDLTIKPFMLFSGDSGLGKSYLASLCHYFYRLLTSYEIFDGFVHEMGWNYLELSQNYHDQGVALTISKEILESWLSNDCVRYVGYLIGNENIEGTVDVILPSVFPDNLVISYREELIGLVGKEEMYMNLSLLGVSLRANFQPDFVESPFAALLRFGFANILYGNPTSIKMAPIFPPSRGTLLTEEVTPITGMYAEYKRLQVALERASAQPIQLNEGIKAMMQNILEGNVTYREGRYYYEVPGIPEMPLSAAAASVRELTPITRLANRVDMATVAILFEEPETHLHPAKQRMMADVMGALLNAGAKLIITTHSNYFIARLNELIQFYRLKNRGTVSDEQLKELRSKLKIEEGVEFDSEAMGVYMLRLREDGLSEVVPQDLEDGVPYTAFLQATKDDIFNRDILTKVFEDVAE